MIGIFGFGFEPLVETGNWEGVNVVLVIHTVLERKYSGRTGKLEKSFTFNKPPIFRRFPRPNAHKYIHSLEGW